MIAIRADSVEHFRGAALTYAVLGLLELLSAALHSADFKDGAALPLFAAFFVSVLAVGTAGCVIGREGQASSSRRAFSGS